MCIRRNVGWRKPAIDNKPIIDQLLKQHHVHHDECGKYWQVCVHPPSIFPISNYTVWQRNKSQNSINYQKWRMWDCRMWAAISRLQGTVIVIVEAKGRCLDPRHDKGFGFDRWLTGGRKRVMQYRYVQPQTTHTHRYAQTCTFPDTSPASRPPLIEMEERCGRSKCLQMTRWEWIGSCALVMLLHLHQRRKTGRFHGRRPCGRARQAATSGGDVQWKQLLWMHLSSGKPEVGEVYPTHAASGESWPVGPQMLVLVVPVADCNRTLLYLLYTMHWRHWS